MQGVSKRNKAPLPGFSALSDSLLFAATQGLHFPAFFLTNQPRRINFQGVLRKLPLHVKQRRLREQK